MFIQGINLTRPSRAHEARSSGHPSRCPFWAPGKAAGICVIPRAQHILSHPGVRCRICFSCEAFYMKVRQDWATQDKVPWGQEPQNSTFSDLRRCGPLFELCLGRRTPAEVLGTHVLHDPKGVCMQQVVCLLIPFGQLSKNNFERRGRPRQVDGFSEV